MVELTSRGAEPPFSFAFPASHLDLFDVVLCFIDSCSYPLDRMSFSRDQANLLLRWNERDSTSSEPSLPSFTFKPSTPLLPPSFDSFLFFAIPLSIYTASASFSLHAKLTKLTFQHLAPLNAWKEARPPLLALPSLPTLLDLPPLGPSLTDQRCRWIAVPVVL